MKKSKMCLLLLCIAGALSSCASPPNTADIDGVDVAVPSHYEIDFSETPAVTLPDNAVPETIDEFNLYCVNKEDGNHISSTCKINENYVLKIDAYVETSTVEKVGIYEYIPSTITDKQRDAFLYEFFGDRINDVVYSGVNFDNWILESDTEYYRFSYSQGMKLIYEETFFLRDFKTYIEEHDYRMLNSIDMCNLRISLEEAYSMCDKLWGSLTDDKYIPTNVRPFTVSSNNDDGMLWIVLRKSVDGMPIFADNDPIFYVTDNGVLQMRGAVYKLSPLILDKQVITLNEAVKQLQSYASRLNPQSGYLYLDHFYKSSIPISKISFEYIVMRGTTVPYIVKPVWRFYIGETSEDNLILEDRILAIDAITGDLIAERRGHTF